MMESFILRIMAIPGQRMDSGLGGAPVTSFAVNSHGFVFAGTGGKSVYRSIEPITTMVSQHQETPAAFRLWQNYPNPFNAEP